MEQVPPGDFTLIGDELVDALLSILRNSEEPENATY
jgi:hypothetical protein